MNTAKAIGSIVVSVPLAVLIVLGFFTAVVVKAVVQSLRNVLETVLDVFDVSFRRPVDIYDASTGQWTEASLSQDRGEMAIACVGAEVLFAGGIRPSDRLSNRVDIYDSTTGTWRRASLSEKRRAGQAMTIGTKVLFAGGDPRDRYSGPVYYVDATGQRRASGSGSSVVDIYDSATDAWGTASLSQARVDFAVASVGSKVLFAGGSWSWVGTRHYSAMVDLYDAGTGQ